MRNKLVTNISKREVNVYMRNILVTNFSHVDFYQMALAFQDKMLLVDHPTLFPQDQA